METTASVEEEEEEKKEDVVEEAWEGEQHPPHRGDDDRRGRGHPGYQLILPSPMTTTSSSPPPSPPRPLGLSPKASEVTFVQFGMEEFQEWILMDTHRLPFFLDFIPSDLTSVVALALHVAHRSTTPTTQTDSPHSGGTPHMTSGELPTGAAPRGSDLLSASSFLGAPPPPPPLSGSSSSFVSSHSSAASGGVTPVKRSLTQWLLRGTTATQGRRLLATLAVLDAPVMTMTGDVVLYGILEGTPRRHASLLPLFHLIGDPLPPTMYFMLCMGLVMPSVVSSLAQHMLIERMPLNDTPLYRHVLRCLNGVRIYNAKALRMCAEMSSSSSTIPTTITTTTTITAAGRGSSAPLDALARVEGPRRGKNRVGNGLFARYLLQYDPTKDPPLPLSPAQLLPPSFSSLLATQPVLFVQECIRPSPTVSVGAASSPPLAASASSSSSFLSASSSSSSLAVWQPPSLGLAVQHALFSARCDVLQKLASPPVTERWPVCGDTWLCEMYQRRAALLFASVTSVRDAAAATPSPLLSSSSSSSPVAAAWGSGARGSVSEGSERETSPLHNPDADGGRGEGGSTRWNTEGLGSTSTIPHSNAPPTPIRSSSSGGGSGSGSSSSGAFECQCPLRFYDMLAFAAVRLEDPSAFSYADQVAYQAMRMMSVEELPCRLQKQQQEEAARVHLGVPGGSSVGPPGLLGAGGGGEWGVPEAVMGHGAVELSLPPLHTSSSSPSSGVLSDLLLPTSTSIPECCAMITLRALDSLGYFVHRSEQPTPFELSSFGMLVLHLGSDPDEVPYTLPETTAGGLGGEVEDRPGDRRTGSGGGEGGLLGSYLSFPDGGGGGGGGGGMWGSGSNGSGHGGGRYVYPTTREGEQRPFRSGSPPSFFPSSFSPSNPTPYAPYTTRDTLSSTSMNGGGGGGIFRNESSHRLCPPHPLMGEEEKEVMEKGYQIVRECCNLPRYIASAAIASTGLRLPLPPRPIGWKSVSEYLVFLIDLIRCKAFTDDPLLPLTHTTLQKDEYTTEEYPVGIRLAARLFSILPITLRTPTPVRKTSSPSGLSGNAFSSPTAWTPLHHPPTTTTNTNQPPHPSPASHTEELSAGGASTSPLAHPPPTLSADAPDRDLLASVEEGRAARPRATTLSSSSVVALPGEVMEWRGPFDPDIACFHTTTRTLSHALRETVESMAVCHFASGLSLVPPLFWPTVVQQLPFHSAPHSFHAGTVMLYVLLRTIASPSSAPRLTVAELGKVFPDWSGGKADLWWWWMFWQKAMKMFTLPSTSTAPLTAPMGSAMSDPTGELYDGPMTRAGGIGFDAFYPRPSQTYAASEALERGYREVESIFGEANIKKMHLANEAVNAAFLTLLPQY